MRLATIKTSQGSRAALFHQGNYIDLNSTDSSLPLGVKCLLEMGQEGLAKAQAILNNPKAVKLSPEEVSLEAPVPNPNKIICIGLNYRDHAEEAGAAIPREPIIFSKYQTALVGSGQPILLPPVSSKVDYEAELVLVVGKKGKNLSASEAMGYLAGYTVGHDVSARDWQLEKDGKQWMIGKTFDTFAPCGPHLVTCDEVPNPMNLGIRLRLNGQTMQDSSTSQLIFSPGEILAYLSKVFTLLPGDLIFTGTPPGVGMARKPPVFLKAGDMVEVEIDSLGLLKNPCVLG
ncbi:MAG: FAA hydrolase family protein [Gemmataceae bacterium]|nr:FAA hydrolase family protein [Gemmataceae bacterium]